MWYVYMLCDPDTEEPFYIGKGTGDRIDDHERFVDSRWMAMNKEKNRIIRRILAEGKHVLKKIIAEFDAEQDAYVYEWALINMFYGHVTNLRDGGGKRTQKISATTSLPPASEIQRADLNEMLSANEAGKLLGVSGKTVIRLMEEGEFPGYRIGIAWKFRRGDIEAYRESRRYRPRPDEED